MKLRDKTERWQNGKTYVGKKNKCDVTVSYVSTDFTEKKDYWYYMIDKKDIDYSYNSLWDNLHYETQEECVDAAEKKIDELVKNSN